MSKNPLIYPEDFLSPTQLGGGTVGSGVTLESAVTSIEAQARDTALQQGHTRRISGQSAIANQNRLVRTGGLMPLSEVGSVSIASRLLGTAAYTGGTECHAAGGRMDSFHKILFLNEVALKLNTQLSRPRIYCGTIGDVASGKYVGGYSHHIGQTFRSIDKIIYATDQAQRISATLDERMIGIAGGMGDSVQGILAGGVSPQNLMASRKGYAYKHVSDTIASIANFLARPKIVIHNGFSSKSAGYMWIGSDRMWRDNWSYLGDSSIEKVGYTNGASTPIATSINSQAKNQIAHASLNSEVKGYVAAGHVTTPIPYYSDMITAFMFSGETSAVLNARLNYPNVCTTGASCSAYGLVIGGNTPANKLTWDGSTFMEKVRFDTETVELLGSRLSVPYADQGSISDYSPGFSY